MMINWCDDGWWWFECDNKLKEDKYDKIKGPK